MTRINELGYLVALGTKGTKRNWWLVKEFISPNGTLFSCGVIYLSSTIRLPKRYIGKRVRIKIEVMPDDEKMELMENKIQK